MVSCRGSVAKFILCLVNFIFIVISLAAILTGSRMQMVEKDGGDGVSKTTTVMMTTTTNKNDNHSPKSLSTTTTTASSSNGYRVAVTSSSSLTPFVELNNSVVNNGGGYRLDTVGGYNFNDNGNNGDGGNFQQQSQSQQDGLFGFDLLSLRTISTLLIFVGFILGIISIFGFGAAICESPLLLNIYVYFVGLCTISLCILYGGIVFFNEPIIQHAQHLAKQWIANATDGELGVDNVDAMIMIQQWQQRAMCCGVDSPLDWSASSIVWPFSEKPDDHIITTTTTTTATTSTLSKQRSSSTTTTEKPIVIETATFDDDLPQDMINYNINQQNGEHGDEHQPHQHRHYQQQQHRLLSSDGNDGGNGGIDDDETLMYSIDLPLKYSSSSPPHKPFLCPISCCGGSVSWSSVASSPGGGASSSLINDMNININDSYQTCLSTEIINTEGCFSTNQIYRYKFVLNMCFTLIILVLLLLLSLACCLERDRQLQSSQIIVLQYAAHLNTCRNQLIGTAYNGGGGGGGHGHGGGGHGHGHGHHGGGGGYGYGGGDGGGYNPYNGSGFVMPGGGSNNSYMGGGGGYGGGPSSGGSKYNRRGGNSNSNIVGNNPNPSQTVPRTVPSILSASSSTTSATGIGVGVDAMEHHRSIPKQRYM